VAGYYPAIIPVPGDVFRATIPSAAAARGAALYVTGAQTVTTVAGTNIIGHVLDHAGFPRQQGNATVGDVADRGTTVQAQTTVHMTIKNAASYWNALQGDSVV